MSDFYNKYPYTDFHELNLDWIIERVKQLTEDWLETKQAWENTEADWQELYTYVHDYFDNLNVQTEINNKIDAMILDGTFQQIATPIIQAKVAADLPGVVSDQIGATVAGQIDDTVALQIGGAVANQIDDAVVSPVNSWLADHITQPTTPAVDDSLSISGAAADAAATGFRIDDVDSLLYDNHVMINRNLRKLTDCIVSDNATYTFTAPDLLNAQTDIKWDAILIAKDEIEFQLTNTLEYIVLSSSIFEGARYLICLALTDTSGGTRYGNLLAIKLGDEGVSITAFDGINHLTGSTYDATNFYKITYNGNGIFSVKPSDIGSAVTIDLSNYSQALSGDHTVVFDEQWFGFLTSSLITGGVTMRVIMQPEDATLSDYSVMYEKPAVIPFSASDFINATGDITTSLSGNKMTVSSSVSTFGWNNIKSLDISIRGKSYLEYVILASTSDIAICLTVNASQFGKLIIMRSAETHFTRTNSSVLPGASYDANNNYRFTYMGSRIWRITVNNLVYNINLNDYADLKVDGRDSLALPITLGIFAASTHNVELYINDTMETISSKPWKNHKWFVFGDSITAQGRYIAAVDNELGTISTKYGHGGYSLAQLATVYTEMIAGVTPDLITIFGGTNDFGHSGSLQDMKDGLETILTGLYTAYPTKQIVIITPLQRNFTNTEQYPSETTGLGPNALGLYLIDYVEAIREIAEKYGTPCIDLYSYGGINVLNAASKTDDGLHPSTAYGPIFGHIIAQHIADFTPFD